VRIRFSDQWFDSAFLFHKDHYDSAPKLNRGFAAVPQPPTLALSLPRMTVFCWLPLGPNQRLTLSKIVNNTPGDLALFGQ
jgi:hypothetical protein